MKLTDLEGNTERAACRRLQSLAAQVDPPAVVVELGSYKGRTACWMASQARTRLFCVDAWETGNAQHRERVAAGYADPTKYAHASHWETFRRQITAAGVADRITPIKALSTEPAADWTLPVGLLYIDADHRYEAVRADFEAWSHHVVAGGRVAFHDYGNPRLGVQRFVGEHVRTDPAWGEFEALLWRKHPRRRGLFVARRRA